MTDQKTATKPVKQGDVWPLLYRFTRAALRLMYWANGGYAAIGLENIPKTGNGIIAPNHVSHTDPPLISITNPRPVTIMAKEELFKLPILGAYIAHLGTFPVKRGTADRVALRMAMDRLAQGRLLLLFPEGTRGDGETLQEPERGLGMIATKSGAPVIPAYITGTIGMLPRGATRLHRSHATIVYGKPIQPSQFTEKHAGDELAAAVMAEIDQLKSEYAKMH